MNIPLEIVLLPLFFFGNWFFAGIETGIMAINRHRLLHLVRGGSRRARLIEGYLLDSQRLLGTTLVGVNLCTVILSTLCGSLSGRVWGAPGQALAGALLALAILVWGEYLPKRWFSSRPIQRSLRFAPLLRGLELSLRPLSFLALRLTRLLVPPGKAATLLVTRDHIQTLAKGSEAGGAISPFERLLINQVFALQMVATRQLMTPIGRVAAVAPQATLAASFEVMRQAGHLRLPVLEPATGVCLGVLDTLEALTTPALEPQACVRDHMRPPLFVGPDFPADDLLPLLRRHRQAMAIVRESAGGAALGIVTQENILAPLISGAMPREA